jgi:hypothetical protein
MDFFRPLVAQNIEGVTAFVDRLVTHDGDVNFQHLYKVVEDGDAVSLRLCDGGERVNHYSVLIGGEVCNSFSPLYEISSLFRGLFLTGVGTAFLGRYGDVVEKGRMLERGEIAEMVTGLEEGELRSGIENPVVSIICDLDTDIEPYRYMKHQLWGLEEVTLKKRCADISRDELMRAEIEEDLRGIYWVEEDLEIARRAVGASSYLPEAKAVQFYLTGKIFLDKLGIDISRARLYFQFVPKEELMFLGPDSDVLKVIMSLHNPQSMKILGKLLESKTPWTFSFSCPNCGESSKRVINPEFSKSFDAIHLKCSQSKREFRNEAGKISSRQGCGHKWKVPISQQPDQFFEILKNSSFTLSCAVRELVRVVKTSSLSPICYVANSIGVEKDSKEFKAISDLPRGFGDHQKLMTSILFLQYLLVAGELNSEMTQILEEKKILRSKEMQLLVRASLDRLYDESLECADFKGLYVTDSSALKALKKGQSVWQMFQRSIDIHEITLPELMVLKTPLAS